jgi:hypothetical protein
MTCFGIVAGTSSRVCGVMLQNDIVIQDVTVFANPFNEPDEDEAKQIKALELQRLDVRVVLRWY